MAAITVQQIVPTGLEAGAATASAAGGDTVVNNGKTYIIVTDTGTTAPTVTIAAQSSCNQGFDHDYTIAITAGEARKIGPFAENMYNNSSGQIEVAYSSETDVTIEAYSL